MSTTTSQTAHNPQPLADWRTRLPNALTVLRVLLAAGVVGLLSTLDLAGLFSDRAGHGLWALSHPAVGTLALAIALFVAAALTDALDGALARRWNAVSRFGRVMDPFADKLLILGTFALLAGPAFSVTHDAVPIQVSGVHPWMVVVMLARELLVTSIRGAYEADGIDFSAGPTGKLKMVLQSLAAPAVMFLVAVAAPLPGTNARAIVLVLVWATVLTTALSVWPYIARAARSTPPSDHRAPKTRATPNTTSRARPPRRGSPTPELGVPAERIEVPAARTKRERSTKAKAKSRPKRGSGASDRRKPGNTAPEDAPEDRDA